jgi:hypothetical protein
MMAVNFTAAPYQLSRQDPIPRDHFKLRRTLNLILEHSVK